MHGVSGSRSTPVGEARMAVFAKVQEVHEATAVDVSVRRVGQDEGDVGEVQDGAGGRGVVGGSKHPAAAERGPHGREGLPVVRLCAVLVGALHVGAWVLQLGSHSAIWRRCLSLR